MSAGRLPDVVVIGRMKSGTTTLHRWLQQHPGAWMSSPKELNFFCDDTVWARGVDWYAAQFEDAPPDSVAGESSPGYTRPGVTAVAAGRIRATLPDVRVVCVLRDPVERLRSHYRHDVQTGRQTATFAEAMAQGGGKYVAGSQYYRCLEPYLDAFPIEQLCVVTLDDLVADGNPGWRSVLGHVGLPWVVPPGEVENVTAAKPRLSAAGRALRRARVIKGPRGIPSGRGVPKPVRRAARRVLFSDDDTYRRLLAGSVAPVAPDITDALWDDLDRLAERLDRGRFWPRPPYPSQP